MLFATWTTNITNRWEIPQFQDCKYTCIVFLRFFPIILCTTNDEPIFHFYLFVIATHLLTKVTRNFLCASDARDEMKFDGNNRKKTDFHSFSHAQYESFCTNRYEMIPRTCFTQKSETEQKRTKLLNTNRILTLLQLPNSLISRQLKQCGWKKRTYWRAKKRNNKNFSFETILSLRFKANSPMNLNNFKWNNLLCLLRNAVILICKHLVRLTTLFSSVFVSLEKLVISNQFIILCAQDRSKNRLYSTAQFQYVHLTLLLFRWMIFVNHLFIDTN